MKAIVHTEFRALRLGEKRNSKIEVGEVVDGDLAVAAVENGFGEEVPEDAPVGKELVQRHASPKPVSKAAPAPAPQAKAAKGKASKKAEPDAGDGDGDSGDGDEGEGD